MLPDLIINIILTLLLVWLWWKSMKKAIETYQKEKKEEEKVKAGLGDVDLIKTPGAFSRPVGIHGDDVKSSKKPGKI